MQELKLHDIKGLVEIPDDSIYYFYSLLGLILISIIIVSIFIYKFVKREKQENLQKLYLAQLNELKIEDSKESAYQITHLGHALDKNTLQEEAFLILVNALAPYKYQKNVPQFEADIKEEIQNFKDAMNV